MGKGLIDTVEKNDTNRARLLVLMRGADSIQDSEDHPWSLGFEGDANDDLFFGIPRVSMVVPKESEGDRHFLVTVDDDRGRLGVARMFVGKEGSQRESDALDLLLGITGVSLYQHGSVALNALFMIAHMMPEARLSTVRPMGATEVCEAILKMAAGDILMASAAHFDLDILSGVEHTLHAALADRVVNLNSLG